MEATVAERGQITLPKAARDALGLTKGTLLKVEIEGGRLILSKNVNDAISRARGKFKLAAGVNADQVVEHLRGVTAVTDHAHTSKKA
jgi:antitoxin PrlF